MLFRRLILLVALLGPAAAFAADAIPCSDRVSPGQELKVEFPGYHGFIKTWLPEQAPPDGRFPVIVHYHGYSENLHPHVRIARAITADRYFLSVGMDYGSYAFYEDLDRSRIPEEVARLDKVIDWLAECVDIDRDEIYLSGYSQGAFAISLIGERVLDRIGGIIYLGGGRSEGEDNLPSEQDLAGFPVFVGYGEDDEVYGEVAEVTGRVYALLGAKVARETWPGMDHTSGFSWYMQDRSHVVNINNWLLDNTFFDEPAAGK